MTRAQKINNGKKKSLSFQQKSITIWNIEQFLFHSSHYLVVVSVFLFLLLLRVVRISFIEDYHLSSVISNIEFDIHRKFMHFAVCLLNMAIHLYVLFCVTVILFTWCWYLFFNLSNQSFTNRTMCCSNLTILLFHHFFSLFLDGVCGFFYFLFVRFNRFPYSKRANTLRAVLIGTSKRAWKNVHFWLTNRNKSSCCFFSG